MRNYNHTTIGAVFAFLIVALLASCTSEGPCEGSMVLTNPISDVTVAVGDTVNIDLTNPPVFVSSEDRIAYFPRIRSGFFNISVNRLANDDGNLSILVVMGKTVGESMVELEASSGCLEGKINFNVIVVTQ